MINRRSLMFGAAATAAVAATPAAALPARVLDLVPCDGRVLPVAQYFDLFKAIGFDYGGSLVSETFCVPDLRARVVAPPEPINVLPVDMGIVAARDLIWPVGTILNLPTSTTLEQALRSISGELHELNRRHRLHVREMLHG